MSPSSPLLLFALLSAAAMWHIARFVGARPALRDPIDQRIVTAALNGTARQIDSQDEVVGYPKHEPVTRALDVPDTKRAAWLEKQASEVTFGVETSKAE